MDVFHMVPNVLGPSRRFATNLADKLVFIVLVRVDVDVYKQVGGVLEIT